VNKQNRPLVSVIIPTYNRKHLLLETICSVRAQTYQNIEIVVCDDGSTDGTYDEIQSQRDVKLVRTKNLGPASARNAGFKLSKGKLVSFLDSDDLWLSTKLEQQVDVFNTTDARFVYSEMYIFGGGTSKAYKYNLRGPAAKSGYVFDELSAENFVGAPTPVIDREVFNAIGLFDTRHKFKYVEDWDMWLRIARVCAFHYIKEPLAKYRVHAENGTYRRDERRVLVKRREVLAKNLNPSGENAKQLRKMRGIALANCCRGLAKQSQMPLARKYAAKLLINAPIGPREISLGLVLLLLPSTLVAIAATCTRFLRAFRKFSF
jgi:GT2 family glycosyltransferase